MKLFAIPMMVYVKAINEEIASGVGEETAFTATEAVRKVNSGWIQDKTTTFVTSGDPVIAERLPNKLYNKDKLIKAYGEERAIRLLNHIVNIVHP